jgi:AcrR family transcriptional regulator
MVDMARGEATRERIVDRALRLASRDGLEGLSIGGLAADLGLSKSGLFAHFGSKEDLQLAVLHEAVARFETTVVRPAVRAPRGEPRIRALFANWLDWMADPAFPGGCILLAASVELDDREGRPRDYLAGTQRLLLGTLAKAARITIEAGQFRPDLDCDQFAFEVYALVLARGHWKRMIRDPQADTRARAAFEALLARSRAAS